MATSKKSVSAALTLLKKDISRIESEISKRRKPLSGMI
jgi:hypothetical protein